MIRGALVRVYLKDGKTINLKRPVQKLVPFEIQAAVKQENKQEETRVADDNIIKRIEVRTRLAVFTDRQCERDNGRLSVNSLAVIQIIRQAGVLLSKQ